MPGRLLSKKNLVEASKALPFGVFLLSSGLEISLLVYKFPEMFLGYEVPVLIVLLLSGIISSLEILYLLEKKKSQQPEE